MGIREVAAAFFTVALTCALFTVLGGRRDQRFVTTDSGDRLWLCFAHGAAMSPGWFCHGEFP